MLPYEKESVAAINSGVFAEAASFGRPVVTPSGSWMSQQIDEGRATGAVYDEPTPESIAAALSEALQSLPRLASEAGERAARMSGENSCQRALELMLSLAAKPVDMKPRYGLGEEIDFSDPYDSRCFMRDGWSFAEPWGTWTNGDQAVLSLCIDAEPPEPLTLHARVKPFLATGRNRVTVRVFASGREIAVWVFDTDAPKRAWRKAKIPQRKASERNDPLEITFAIDIPQSPQELGVNEDPRRLGLGFLRLRISAQDGR